MTLLAAFQVLLARYSGQDDFAVGVPVANRNRPETEALIGYFVNVVVLRTKLSGDPSFREAVARLRQVVLDAFERQEMTLDQVVDAVKPTARPEPESALPGDVRFTEHQIAGDARSGPASLSPGGQLPPPSANFDLTLELFDREEGFQGGLNFSTDLFHPATIDRMVEQYQVLVAAAVPPARAERLLAASAGRRGIANDDRPLERYGLPS